MKLDGNMIFNFIVAGVALRLLNDLFLDGILDGMLGKVSFERQV